MSSRARVTLAANMTKASGDFYAGLRYGLATLLQSPEFLFRKEVAVPAGGKDYTLILTAAPPGSAI